MKKIINSNIGIWTISIIPTLITYLTTFKSVKMNINISQHLPFIISISVLIFCISFLYIRKWMINKFNGLEQYIDLTIENSSTITDFSIAKQDEQFIILLRKLFEITGDKRYMKMKRANRTASEKILMKRLSKFDKERLSEISRLLNKDFEVNKSDEDETKTDC